MTALLKQVYKKIRLRPQKLDCAGDLIQAMKVSPVASRILAARGYESGKLLTNFLNPTLQDGLEPPEKLKNLLPACELIAQMVNAGKSIAVCCDFDVDGLSGGAQVVHFLRSINCTVEAFVPDRFEDGYGLNPSMIQAIADKGHALLIAIDFGTSNEKEIALANDLGLKTIVVDHHHIGSHVSPAHFFINPQQKECGFAGGTLSAAGLAWYLLLGMRRTIAKAEGIDVREYLDLACLGTICDMVPLQGVNRVIAKRGLERLSITTRPGLVALKNAIGAKAICTCTDVSFGIGPRINAAGRMVHGGVVIDLLAGFDQAKCNSLASKLNTLNQERQETELYVKEIAVAEVSRLSKLPYGIVVFNKDFHTGVIGIVAQRLVEHYYRPAIVLGPDSDGIYKGSVRGIKGFSVVEALDSISELLIKFGGHAGAGGFSVHEKNLPQLVEAFDAECAKRLATIETEPYVDADTEVGLGEVTRDLVKELRQFAPFGMGNPGPVLLAKKLKVSQIQTLKKAHLKVTFTDGKFFYNGFLWRQTEHPKLQQGAVVSVAFRPELSMFQGTEELQLQVQAVD